MKAGINNLSEDKLAFAADSLDCSQIQPSDLRHLPHIQAARNNKPIRILLSLANTRLGLFHITPPNIWIAIGTALPLPSCLTAIDALCGIGRFAAALIVLAIHIAVAFDHDFTVIQQSARNFPPNNKTIILQADIQGTNIFYHMVGHHILLCGFPCQPFSSLGLQRGRHDPRSCLHAVLELIFLLRPPIVILENVVAFLQFQELVTDIRAQAAAMHYFVTFDQQDSAAYLPQSRIRLGILFVRADHSFTPISTIASPDTSLLLPTPPTTVHRGIFFEHPCNSHTRVDPDTYRDMIRDNTIRHVTDTLHTQCTKYRNNQNYRPPRIGQWFALNGIPYWICPRAFARSLGFGEHFHLHQDDLTNYRHLGNALAPPTALIWIARTLQSIGVPSSQFATAFTRMLFEAIPPAFPSPITRIPLIPPTRTNAHALPLISQRTGLHEDLVSLALSAEHQTTFIMEQDDPTSLPLTPHILLKLLSKAKLTSRHIARNIPTPQALASAIRGAHQPATSTALAIDLLAHNILNDSPSLTASLAELIDEQDLAIQPAQHAIIVTHEYPQLATHLANHYWDTINATLLSHALLSAKLANSPLTMTTSSQQLRHFAATTNTASIRTFIAIPPGPSTSKRRLIATTSLNELLQRSLIQAAIANIHLYALPTAPPHDMAVYALTRDHFAHILAANSVLFTSPSGLQRQF